MWIGPLLRMVDKAGGGGGHRTLSILCGQEVSVRSQEEGDEVGRTNSSSKTGLARAAIQMQSPKTVHNSFRIILALGISLQGDNLL